MSKEDEIRTVMELLDKRRKKNILVSDLRDNQPSSAEDRKPLKK